MARDQKFTTPNLGLITYDEVLSGQLTELEKFRDQFARENSNLTKLDEVISGHEAEAVGGDGSHGIRWNPTEKKLEVWNKNTNSWDLIVFGNITVMSIEQPNFLTQGDTWLQILE